MKKFKKTLTAAIAAFAVISTVGSTTVFALSHAVNSVDTVNDAEQGTYMRLNYGPGNAITRNYSGYTRYCVASVEVYDEFGNEVPNSAAWDSRSLPSGGVLTVAAIVESKFYNKPQYKYVCRGAIYHSDSHYAPIWEEIVKEYPM